MLVYNIQHSAFAAIRTVGMENDQTPNVTWHVRETQALCVVLLGEVTFTVLVIIY